MFERNQALSPHELNQIHTASLEVLQDVGVAFHDPEAIEIFSAHGIKTEDNKVFLTERDVRLGLSSVPAQFTVYGRDPDKQVVVGGEGFVFLPASGPPFVVTLDGEQRPATLIDHQHICMLVQTSKQIDMGSVLAVEPCDIDSKTAYLDMLLSSLLLCDKPFLAYAPGRQASRDGMEMTSLAFGGEDKIRDRPVMVGSISPSSPLQYSKEAGEGIIEFARWGQPLLIACCVMGGSSGPVAPAGILTLQNAEILAGIVLSQLVKPGLPIIYGATSCPLDMRSGAISIGAPETAILAGATAQMAQFYDLPSRSGGDLTDAHFPDIQAGIESALTLLTAARQGINFILHSCGILASFLAMSFEKFIADEEACAMVRKMLTPIEVNEDTIDLETIKEAGIGGSYLTKKKTLAKCRTEYYIPELMNRQGFGNWKAAGKKPAHLVADEIVQRRLAAYEQPPIEPDREQTLRDFVDRKKEDYGATPRQEKLDETSLSFVPPTEAL